MTKNPSPHNPLLQEWNTPFNIAPFDQVSPEHFRPAVEYAIEVARREVDEIVASQAEPGFVNTIEALERAVDHGFADSAHILADPDLEALRTSHEHAARLQALVQRLRPGAPEA